jgi:hypothetical protein
MATLIDSLGARCAARFAPPAPAVATPPSLTACRKPETPPADPLGPARTSMGPSSRFPRRRLLRPSADAAVKMGWAVPHAGWEDRLVTCPCRARGTPRLPRRCCVVHMAIARSGSQCHPGCKRRSAPGSSHMIIEQLAPDTDHRRELSCEPPVAERAGGRLDHHAPPHAPGPRRERHPWARGHSPVGASLPSAEHTPCRCTCICKCRSDKQLP